MIKHAWLIDVLQKPTSFENQFATAKRFQRLERRFFAEFEKDKAEAKLITIDLSDVLANPSKSLMLATKHIPSASQSVLAMLPDRTKLEGLDNIARKLRNHGLNIDYEPAPRPTEKKKQDAVFEKPYAVK